MEILFGLVLWLASIAVAIAIAIYQFREPDLKVRCQAIEDNPACIDCSVENSGRKESRDVHIAFTNYLPLQTSVFASPEVAADIVEAEQPPDPHLFPSSAQSMRAFAVRIPRVAPNEKIEFRVCTSDEDNKRAAQQILRIRGEIRKVVEDFGKRIQDTYKEAGEYWNLESVWLARIKDECLFSPGSFSYERGRFPVTYYSEEEDQAKAVSQDLLSRYKEEFIDVFQDRPRFKAAVIRIKTSEGPSTFAIFPPHIETYVEVAVPLSDLKKHGGVHVRPPVPKSYD